jgi:hypothetical protein
MSKFFYKPIVGIDISADFSVAAILAPTVKCIESLLRLCIIEMVLIT